MASPPIEGDSNALSLGRAFVRGQGRRRGGERGRYERFERSGDVVFADYLVGPWNEFMGAVSPDGGRAAYVSNESGVPEVYVRSFPEAAGQLRVSENGGTEPVWDPDGSARLPRHELGRPPGRRPLRLRPEPRRRPGWRGTDDARAPARGRRELVRGAEGADGELNRLPRRGRTVPFRPLCPNCVSGGGETRRRHSPKPAVTDRDVATGGGIRRITPPAEPPASTSEQSPK